MLLKQLSEIEQRKNYLEMEDVINRNIDLMASDPDFCIFVIKCVINGGLASGNNDDIVYELEKSKKTGASDITLTDKILGKMFNKKSNEQLASGASSVIKLTNANLIDAIRTIVIYGNNERIDQASKLMETLYPGFTPMMNNKIGIGARAYKLVAWTMCEVGKIIMDNVKLTNKVNFPGAKNMIGAFATEVMKPISEYIRGGILGWFMDPDISKELKERIKDTYQKLLSMK